MAVVHIDGMAEILGGELELLIHAVGLQSNDLRLLPAFCAMG
jgi:hypothetical protein